jgi:ryanodine receptor 2
MPPGLQPAHKMSIILFLERVYGIPDQETFFRLIEDAFLPDIRAATILDMVFTSRSVKLVSIPILVLGGHTRE